MRALHHVVLPILAATCLTGVASRASAQAPADSVADSAKVYQVDLWVTKPTAIPLTPDQQKKFDRIRTNYVTESEAIRKLASGDDMEMVFKARALAAKYQSLVRAILTEEQREVFGRNIRAGVMGR